MQVLISGAGGFLGGHAAVALAAQGYRVRALTRQGIAIPGVETLRIRDYFDRSAMEKAVRGVDAVVHLAGLAHESRWRPGHERRMMEAHVQSSDVLATASLQQGVRRWVYVSSLSVWGSSFPTPLEPTLIPQPLSAYGRAKLRAEEILRKMCRGTPMGLVILRPPMIYGKNAPGNFMRLAQWIRCGLPVPVSAEPHPRSLLHLDNFLSLLGRILESPGEPEGPVLVQDDRPVTTEELARRIGQAVGRPAQIWKLSSLQIRILGALTRGVVSQKLCGRLVVDTTQTERFYRWRPPVSVEEAISRSLKQKA